MPRPDPFAARALLGPHASPCRRAMNGETGIALPPLHDHHVHTHLIDLAAVAAGGIAAVVDLGGDPAALARISGRMPLVTYAGAFLTAPGGYPAGRSWAPPSTVREVTGHSALGDPAGAETAVDEQAGFGASVIKVALNVAAGPVFDADTLAAVVARSREHGLPVVAHVQGAGMTQLAMDAEVDALAHTPFTEVVPAELVARAVSLGQRWISTLDIHRGAPDDAARAVANLSAFAAAGGTVLYGTDLGNGDLPLGVNAREVAGLVTAGLEGRAVIAALTDPWPLGAAGDSDAVCTFVAGPPPADAVGIASWVTGARVVPAEELLHDEP